MDERVLKIFTVIIAVMTFSMCWCFTFFPDMHEQYVLAEETRRTRLDEINLNIIQKISQPDETIADEAVAHGQLKLQLPRLATKDNVVIENDYLNQTVYIKIPGGSDDFIQNNGISGSCNNISSLSYYKEGEYGVVAINTDLLYECQSNFEGDNLYLDFLDPHDIYDKVIVIDAGHGSRASGATRNGIEEKNINLAIVMQLADIIQSSGENYGIYLTRTDDSNPSLAQRSKLANMAKADLFISIHSNASGTGNFSGVKGTQVLYSPSDNNEYSSLRFAEICMKKVTETLGSIDAGLVKADDIYIVRTSDGPVALVEVGYMTNREELELLNTPDYQRLAAQGVFNAIQAAFEEGF